jgi:hypothetical protein
VQNLSFLEILMCSMVNMDDLGLYYVVAGDHFARCWSIGERDIGHN